MNFRGSFVSPFFSERGLMRILGIDYGDARMGVAVSDPTGFLAGGLCCAKVNGIGSAVKEAARLAEETKAELIVVGLPVNMNGSEGERAARVKRFAAELTEACGVETVFIDERRSTILAAGYMNETGTHGKKRKENIDTLSAQIILQTYLDRTRK